MRARNNSSEAALTGAVMTRIRGGPEGEKSGGGGGGVIAQAEDGPERGLPGGGTRGKALQQHGDVRPGV